VPAALTWNETRPAARPGVQVTFDGPGAPTRRVWLGLFTAGFAGVFVKLVYAQPNPTWAHAVPLIILCAGVGLMVQGMPGPHSGRIDIEDGRLRLTPPGLYAVALKLEVLLAEIDYFSSDAQTTTSELVVGGGMQPAVYTPPRSEMQVDEVRYRVFLHRNDGRRHILAVFGERATADAMVQSLEGLVTRARAGWFSSRA
jgi:hypothetical protein